MTSAEVKTLVERWLLNKKELDAAKKLDKGLREETKNILIKSGKDSIKTAVGTATLSTRESVEFDEAAMIRDFSEGPLRQFVKRTVVEEIDFVALESAIFTGSVQSSEVAKYEQKKITYVIGSNYDV